MRIFHDEEHFVGAFFFDLMTGISFSLFRLDPSSITTENASGDGSIIHDLYTSYTITVTAFLFLFFSEDDIALILKLILFRKKWRKF